MTGNMHGFIPAQLRNAASRKLYMLHCAADLRDLAVPPGNALEPLKGSRKGQYIRVNDKYRICFRFIGGNAYDVEIVDYH